MPCFQNLCKVINNSHTENDIKLTLFALSQKKQAQFIDMLYCILEEDTPLFFELFGGQILKIPTKTEFTRTNNAIKIFLFLIKKRKYDEPFKYASYKFNLYLDKIVSSYIEYYEFFIKDKTLDQIDLNINNLEQNDFVILEKIYISAKEILSKIKENPKENKRFTFKKKDRLYKENLKKENKIDDINYSFLLDEEEFNDEDNYEKNLKNDEFSEEEEEEEKNDSEDDAKQLSLF